VKLARTLVAISSLAEYRATSHGHEPFARLRPATRRGLSFVKLGLLARRGARWQFMNSTPRQRAMFTSRFYLLRFRSQTDIKPGSFIPPIPGHPRAVSITGRAGS
jgi:hypothetical protein